jgi:magnesium transporter
VDEKKKLLGTISIKALYRRHPKTKLHEVIEGQDLVYITPATDQEEAANLCLRRGLKGIPVVDEQKKLLGAVVHDAITNILYKEIREDMLRLAGIEQSHSEMDNILEIPFTRALRHRAPWLFLGLLGGLIVAKIIGTFEALLAQNLLLAAFIPLVVYLADAVKNQLEVFAIRDFAIFRKLNFMQYFFKQLAVVVSLSVILGLSLMVFSFLLYGEKTISWVLGVAVSSAILSALVTGLCVPYLFRKIKLDPANASGPIGTILQDTLSVSIYFMVATRVL